MNKTTWISTNWNRGKERKKQLRHRLHQSPRNESTKQNKVHSAVEIVLTHQKPFPKMGYEPGPCHIPPLW